MSSTCFLGVSSVYLVVRAAMVDLLEYYVLSYLRPFPIKRFRYKSSFFSVFRMEIESDFHQFLPSCKRSR